MSYNSTLIIKIGQRNFLWAQASEFRSAIGKCRPDCRPILMSGRQKVADLNFALE